MEATEAFVHVLAGRCLLALTRGRGARQLPMYDVWVMRRTNIYLADEELSALRLIGRRQGRPVAVLVREAVDTWLMAQGVQPIDEDAWARRFDLLLDRRRRAAAEAGWEPVEVERDVAAAVEEVRRDRAAGRH